MPHPATTLGGGRDASPGTVGHTTVTGLDAHPARVPSTIPMPYTSAAALGAGVLGIAVGTAIGMLPRPEAGSSDMAAPPPVGRGRSPRQGGRLVRAALHAGAAVAVVLTGLLAS